MNKVFLSGYLGKKPEIRYTAKGTAVANFSLGTSERFYKSAEGGEKKLVESTEWNTIKLFGAVAEYAGKYLDKGSRVNVVGKLSTEEWMDKDNVQQRRKVIVVDELENLTARPKTEAGATPTPQPAPLSEQHDDDIPF